MIDVAFDLRLDHGRCIVVLLPEAGALEHMARATLLAQEMEHAATLRDARRRSYLGGRVAMREALSREGIGAPAVLSDDRGAPLLPPGVTGSITHKRDVAAALVTREQNARVGIDLEEDVPTTLDLSRQVLTPGEIAELSHLGDAPLAREVLLRFSAKEALYKALDPFVRRFVGFTEVSVTPRPDGTARVGLRLRPGEGPFAADVRWARLEGLVVTTARVHPSPGAP
jgi:4'-phosphopantetheinyl transferase EntD